MLQQQKAHGNTQKVDRNYSPPVEVCTKNLSQAAELLGRVDPRCKKILDVISVEGKQKLKFELINDAERAAKAVGDNTFQGDAYTVSMITKDKVTGRLTDERHLCYIEGRATNTLGRTMVTMQHELYHMERAHSGKASQDRKREERETFQESYAASVKMAVTFDGMAAKEHDKGKAASYRQIASEIRDCLAYEKKNVTHWSGK